MTHSTAVLVLKTLAACSATAMICSPALLMRQIYKQKDVGVASVIPLVALLANCHVWMVYGYLIENWFPIFWVFLIGDAIALAFLAVYWRFSTQRRYVARALIVVALILAIISIYAIVGGLGYTGQSRANMGSVLGFMADVSAVCLYGAPMEKLLHVLKYKSAVFINVHMVLAGITNNCLWFTYGILTHNWFIISPNILFITLNAFTLVLYAVFNPKTHPLPDNFQLHGHTDGDAMSAMSVELTPKASWGGKTGSNLPSPAFEAMQSPLESIHVAR
ncbi:hypothetical protein BBJ28_00007523 [Nothophytophthora sp. Chile5]|nr:hypothetical protein BBJ28_00007523 [Nothophytophthora sp. Chile5]